MVAGVAGVVAAAATVVTAVAVAEAESALSTYIESSYRGRGGEGQAGKSKDVLGPSRNPRAASSDKHPVSVGQP